VTEEPFEVPPVVRDVAGQDEAARFLARALQRPHHAYLFTGPEGSGKRLGLRAFAAALLCPLGGCGECRDCRLALGERHPNMVVLEPTGPDILVGKDATDPTTARGFARAAYLTPQEPGRKVMVVLQADRLRTEAADVLLKVLEEPPGDTVIVLVSARPSDLPDTIRSRCQEIVFPPLTEAFVVETLSREGVDPEHARLVSRLAGGNIGRARRMARDESGLAFRAAALDAAGQASGGPAGALAAAEGLMAEAKDFRTRLGADLEEDLRPFLDENGKPEEAFRPVVRRIEEQHERRVRRAEREFLDAALSALSSWYRDAVVRSIGVPGNPLINLDLADAAPGAGGAASAALAMGAVEEARALLADETNLNARLLLEHLFLQLASAGTAAVP
jgi:DNA polymerase III subunit delta'